MNDTVWKKYIVKYIFMGSASFRRMYLVFWSIDSISNQTGPYYLLNTIFLSKASTNFRWQPFFAVYIDR